MDNEAMYRLLHQAPEKLLASSYMQGRIERVVNKLLFRGFLHEKDKADLIQEINLAFLQRKMKDIQKNYQPTYGLLAPYFDRVTYRKAIDLLQTRKNKTVGLDTDEGSMKTVEALQVKPPPFDTPQLIKNELARLKTYIQLFHKHQFRLLLLLQLFARVTFTEKDFKRYCHKAPALLVNKLLATFGKPYYHLTDKLVFEMVCPLVSCKEEKQLSPDALRKWSNTHIQEIIDQMSKGPYQYDKESLRNLSQYFYNPNKLQLTASM